MRLLETAQEQIESLAIIMFWLCYDDSFSSPALISVGQKQDVHV